MDLGLYTLKYPFRKLIQSLVPMCANISPNAISAMIVPIGIITAANYYYAPEHPALYVVGVLLIFLRMVVATLDGLVAVTFKKDGPYGEMVNRICPELADLMLIGAIVLASPRSPRLMVAVLLCSWATPFFGLVGLTGARAIQSVGPVGQTDRLAALMAFSAFAYAAHLFAWHVDVMRYFLIWLVIGGALTITLRAYRSLRSAP